MTFPLEHIGIFRYVRPVQQLVAAAKAFADPTRVRIFAALQAGELCVCELCDALGVPQSTLSTHLQVMRDSGLIQARKEGKWIYYALAAGKRDFTRSWLKAFADELSADKILARDRARLKSRLECRENGQCCVGFTNGTKKTK